LAQCLKCCPSVESGPGPYPHSPSPGSSPGMGLHFQPSVCGCQPEPAPPTTPHTGGGGPSSLFFEWAATTPPSRQPPSPPLGPQWALPHGPRTSGPAPNDPPLRKPVCRQGSPLGSCLKHYINPFDGLCCPRLNRSKCLARRSRPPPLVGPSHQPRPTSALYTSLHARGGCFLCIFPHISS